MLAWVSIEDLLVNGGGCKMKKYLIVGNGIVESIDVKIVEKFYDEVYFFGNNLQLHQKLNYQNSRFVIQSFTLNFHDYDDNFKYIRYKKALSLRNIPKGTETLLIGDSFDKKYSEYDKLVIKMYVTHQTILKSVINYFGLKTLFAELKYFDVLKIVCVSLGLKRRLSAALRPSSGYWLIIYLLNKGAQVDTLGITNPDSEYVTKNVTAKTRHHTTIDTLIFNSLQQACINVM